ncbi:UDP-N-acetylglucosamine 2-epimerase [Nitriliruptor alkaliphilus]|uniref:UDP-N-acetylglucosamine 2-epimerase n=1 Tax=Nitriliruptor alkaliphilus TaxID=427918 RepID=UPI0012EE2769|nr:UDP-N-acetylglucosamine 2-epimerase [Nitriliruptor alkaliphilus]
MTDTLHVFIGTKAQYVKTAPLLRLMDDRGVAYRLIDSGQHAALAAELRGELGVRAPDVTLGGSRDITTIPAAIRWALAIAWRLVDGRRLRRELFGGRGGICIVHGDTPSTLLATLLARRAGLEVAHLEAGLRSRSVLEPFPEELIRRIVMRLGAVLFAPDDVAAANLHRRGLGGRTVRTSANTVVDALRYSLGDTPVAPTGPAVVTMHRVENLHRAERVRGFVDLVERLAARGPVTFVVHGPTESTIAPHRSRLEAAGVELVPLLAHARFTRMLAAAPLVVTDGGSIQEECALLGVPTLLWRAQTERPDGLGVNVVLGRYESAVLDRFVDDHEALRRPPLTAQVHPSAEILTTLEGRLADRR